MENKKQLSPFEVARNSFGLLKSNKILLISLAFIYVSFSSMPSFLEEMNVVFQMDVWSSTILYLIAVAASIILGIVFFVNTHNIVSGRKGRGFEVVGQYEVLNYVKAFVVAILMWGLLPVLFLGASFLVGFFYSIPLGVALGIALAILMFYITLTYFFTFYEIIFYNKSIAQSFKSSAQLTNGVKLKMIYGYLLYILLTLIISLVLVLAVGGLSLLIFYLVGHNFQVLEYLTIAAPIALTLFGTLVYSIFSAYMILGFFVTYERLREQENNE